jgi:multicomponent Na+:H+ antiporter subunit E
LIRKAFVAIALLGRFAIELVSANVAVLRIVLRPRLSLRPGIIAYRTELTSAMGKTWLANLITLTPGTLTLFLTEDGSTLYIHTLDIDDAVAVSDGIRRAFESKLLELER